jgi:hypothetical protein
MGLAAGQRPCGRIGSAVRMNLGSRAGDAGHPVRAYVVGMKAFGRAQALDLGLAVIGVVLAAAAVWSANVIGTPVAGPACWPPPSPAA